MTCIFIDSFRCRHAMFSVYFGDPPPKCISKCDICKSTEDVKGKIEDYNSSYQYKSKRTKYFDTSGWEE